MDAAKAMRTPARDVVLAVLLLASAGRALGEIYEWTDASGRKQFTSDLSRVPPSQRAAAEAKARERSARRPAPPASAAPTPSARPEPALRPARHTAEAAALLRERLIEPGGAARWGLDLASPCRPC